MNNHKDKVHSALNQLLIAIAGVNHATQTDELHGDPKSRILRCIDLAMAEFSEATSILQDCAPDARRQLSLAQRKLDSLNSLAILANFLEKDY